MSSLCPSVCLSVTLVICDHIGWKSWKLIARKISPAPFFTLCSQKAIHLVPGEHGGNLGRLEVGYREKVAFWRTKAAISLKRLKIEEKLLWTAYRNLPTFFRTVQSRPPMASPSSRFEVCSLVTPSYLRNR